ncbi:hypothetical protein AB0L53_04755 [Nonomuraea sp. NPDC052129]|uniref:hypothetical protein n=1 Tax=Nonomuraea sp. NPDC052129 TaxID=3154651 RepID=UPI0034404129
MSTAKPRAWPPRTTRARATRPRPPAKQTAQIPDAVTSHYARLLDDSGIMPWIDAELGPRPGPAGVPIRAVLVALMVSIHHSGKAALAEAWRLAAFCLSPTTREHLGLDADRPPADDPHACLADNWRFYRAFDRLTSLLDPARHDHRTRLPQHEADLLATAWQDHDPDHTRKRNLLQDIVTALVLTPARWGKTGTASVMAAPPVGLSNQRQSRDTLSIERFKYS